MSEVEQKTLAQFIGEHYITMTSVKVPANPHRTDHTPEEKKWAAEAFHYCCTFMKPSGVLLTVYYSMGAGHVEKIPMKDLKKHGVYHVDQKDWERCPKPGVRGFLSLFNERLQKQIYRPVPPTAAGVLDCIAADSSSIENARNFEEWAGDYGYDTDSRSAEKSYRFCQDQAQELKAFLGRAAYDELLFKVERQ